MRIDWAVNYTGFIEIVKNMRDAQKKFSKTKQKNDLVAMLEIEKEVDELIISLIKTAKDWDIWR